MAVDKTVNQQTQDSAPTTDDFLLAWDTGSGASKKVAISDLLLLSNPYKFSAYRTTNMNVGTADTKVQFNAENFDTGNNYDAVTNFRFTAPINGFYQLNTNILTTTAGAGTAIGLSFYKNGAQVVGPVNDFDAAGTNPGIALSALLQLTAGDYIEVYVGTGVAAKALDASFSGRNTFSGYLVSKA